jgi:hypothetical protein
VNSGSSTEILFEYEAMERGLSISRPATELSYDRIVDNHGKLIRVQIKMTSFKHGRRFRASIDGKGDIKYAGNVDIIAIYVKPEGNWYFIPFEDTAKLGPWIYLSPTAHKQYLNNWEVFNAN